MIARESDSDCFVDLLVDMASENVSVSASEVFIFCLNDTVSVIVRESASDCFLPI